MVNCPPGSIYTPPPQYHVVPPDVEMSVPMPPVMTPPVTASVPLASSSTHSLPFGMNLCEGLLVLLSSIVSCPPPLTTITLPRWLSFWYFSTKPFKSSVTSGRVTVRELLTSMFAASFTVVTALSATALNKSVWFVTSCTFSVSPSAKAARGTRQSTMHRANRMLTSCFFIMSPSSRCWAAVPKVFIKIIGVKIANCQAFFEKTLRSIEKAKMQPNTRTICERNACMER